MDRRRRKPCKVCGIVAFPPDRTKRGNHYECSAKAVSEAIDSMRAKEGKAWETWVDRVRAAKGREAGKMTSDSLKSRRPDGA